MAGPDFKTITGMQQQTWGLGDFNKIASQTMPVAEALVAEADVRPDQRVLDVACGSGNVALVAARRHGEVHGLDFVPALIDRAKQRAAADDVPVDFRVGDAQALPYADGYFDKVMSVFGVMFAPDQARAAAELLRVTRPGGTIALACWMPTEFGGDIFRAMGKHAPPPPPGLSPPNRWGTEEGIRELLGDGAVEIDTQRKTFMQFGRSIEQSMETMTTWFGPGVRAYGMLDDDGKRAMLADMRAVLERYNRATDGTLVMEAAYLRTIVKRK
jgi:SAM-dependent methyltransferase